MTAKRAGVLLGSALASLAWFSIASTEILGNYVGFNACKDCHSEIVEGWKTTPHAGAFETLKRQGDEKQQNPGCIKCHVVAFEAEGGFIDMELTPELKGVQCESCHGPGRKHAETEDSAHIVGKPAETVCRICHTEGQDKNFNYEKKARLVHGAQWRRKS